MKNAEALPASFRDPSGFLFQHQGTLYRQVNPSYKDHFDHFIESGLYQSLVESGLLIPHEEVEREHFRESNAYQIIRPEIIPFVSYPYEWCFSQLRDAALTTLEIQKKSLEYGMVLKDSSAYNIQFMDGRPVFIDTLSFEKYREGEPWTAYRQFCQHFLAPLALMSLKDVRLNQLFRIYLDGVPLDLASALLPLKSRLRLTLLTHVHLHAKSQQHYNTKRVEKKSRKITRMQMLALISNLESAINKRTWRPKNTEWADYYQMTNYSSDAMLQKKKWVSEFLDRIKPDSVWDLGSNTGVFSRIASEKGIRTVSFDIDSAAVEINYQHGRQKGEKNLLPLLLDLTNPSPAIGWQNQERLSLLERGPADVVLALALIHHLAISNNLPLEYIARFLHDIGEFLIIEFVPKQDSQVQKLFRVREDIFHDYREDVFQIEFQKYFSIQKQVKIENTERTLYLMKKRTSP